MRRSTGSVARLADLGDGGLAVAVDGDRIAFIGGNHDGLIQREAAGVRFTSITAISADGDRLLVAEGSAQNSLEGWRRDLFQRNSSGRVVEIDLLSGQTRRVASDLAWGGRRRSPSDRRDRRLGELDAPRPVAHRRNSGLRQHSGLSWTALCGQRRRILAVVFCGSNAVDRLRASGPKALRADDARG